MAGERDIRICRNYGIDLLRLISMLYVVILHILGHGGVLRAVEEGTIQYRFSWFIELWAYCAVNIFAIISGYVGFSEEKKPYRYSNYLVMWLQVVVYGVLAVVFLQLVNPEYVSLKNLWDMFFPVTNNLYWYFTAYTGLFVLIPFINEALRQLNKETLKKFFVIMFLVFSVFGSITGSFTLNDGYSCAWLCILYIFGATIRKCDIGKNISASAAFSGIMLCCLISWLWKMYGFEFEIINIKIDKHLFESYLSPTHVCAAILYVILFSKIRCKSFFKKIISFAAPGSFAVYLINDQRFIRQYIIGEKFLYIADSPVYIILGHILGVALGFLVIAVMIDYVRRKLFDIFKVKQYASIFTGKIKKIIVHWSDKL